MVWNQLHIYVTELGMGFLEEYKFKYLYLYKNLYLHIITPPIMLTVLIYIILVKK